MNSNKINYEINLCKRNLIFSLKPIIEYAWFSQGEKSLQLNQSTAETGVEAMSTEEAFAVWKDKWFCSPVLHSGSECPLSTSRV